MRITLVICVLSVPAVMLAAQFHVFPGQSIQAAVSAAAELDTVAIHDGTYSETVIPYGRNLTIASLYVLDHDTAHIGNTVITPGTSCPDTASCFVYAYGENLSSRLIGLTLQNGAGTVWMLGSERHTVGGAVYNYLSGVSVEDCRIRHCSAEEGGGVAAVFVDWRRLSRLSIAHCVLQNCSCATWGGGVYANRCSLWVNDCIIDTNWAGMEGGAISAIECYAEVHRSSFRYNESSAAVAVGSTEGEVSECTFEGNDVHEPGFECTDLLAFHSRMAVTGCSFLHNRGIAPAVELDEPQDGSVFSGNLLEYNSAGQGGNGTLITSDTYADISYNIFQHNLNTTSGVIHTFQHSLAHIHHNVFEDNRSNPGRQSVLSAVTYARPVADSNIINHNDGPTMDAPLNDFAGIDARNNWWGDPSGPYHPTLNPAGRGDTLLSDSVLFIPWLTSPPDTTMPNSIEKGRPEIASTWEFFGLYPNPFNSEIRILIAGFTGKDFRLTLHNLLGQEVCVIHTWPLTGGEIYFHAPSTLASGVYFVRAADGKVVETKKAIFMK